MFLRFYRRIEGMELRSLRRLLNGVDANHEWGGLKKVLTLEGHYMRLCDKHAEEYRKKGRQHIDGGENR